MEEKPTACGKMAYLGIKAATGEIIVGNRNGVWLTRTVRRKTARRRWDRRNLEMIVANAKTTRIIWRCSASQQGVPVVCRCSR